MATITERESQQIEQANSDGRTPLVLIHGLRLLPSSWDRWADLFEEAAGYGPVTPVWPDDPDTVEQARLPVLGHPVTRGRAVTPDARSISSTGGRETQAVSRPPPAGPLRG